MSKNVIPTERSEWSGSQKSEKVRVNSEELWKKLKKYTRLRNKMLRSV